jgi:hypothetical protein
MHNLVNNTNSQKLIPMDLSITQPAEAVNRGQRVCIFFRRKTTTTTATTSSPLKSVSNVVVSAVVRNGEGKVGATNFRHVHAQQPGLHLLRDAGRCSSYDY